VGGDDFLYFGYTSGGTNTLTNAAGATLNLSSTNAVPINYFTGTATLNNAGTLNQTATGSHTISSSISFNNTGTLNVSAGTLVYNANLTNQGTVSVAPGARMSVGGSFTNAAQATLRVGLGNATTIGVLAVTGTANLNGTLAVYLDGGYVPASSDVFGVITYANRTGAFSILRGESPGAQMSFSVDTASDSKTLKVQGITVTTVLPGVDLSVTGLGLSADTVLQSGNPVTVVWQDSNTGTLATSSSWTDRLVVRNTATNEILADIQLPYDAAANGPLAGGGSVVRQASFVLPAGNRGAGNFNFTVTADLTNTVTETNSQGSAEINNSASLNLASALAPYPDLIVTDVTPASAVGWLAGDAVTVSWKTRNQGDGATSGSWTETLSVRNLTTGQTLFTQGVPYDAAALGNIAAGASRDRSTTLTWPTGANANGQIQFTVTTDSASQLFENNLAGMAESNNATQITVLSAPDLVVTSLASDQPAPQSGDLLTLTWNDANSGNTAVNAGWYDRIRVTNQSTGAVLVDQALRYDPPPGGALQAGASASRSYSFRLLEGNPGVGNLLIQVSADQNTAGAGSLAEVNAAGTGETNNSASLSLASTLAPYADLVAENLILSPSEDFQPGQQVMASWNTANRGTKAAEQPWSERLEVRNLSTNLLVASITLTDDLSAGALGAGAIRARSTQFTWPSGASASGRFSIRVVEDSAAQLLEANAAGTGESNNTLEIINEAGPDLQIRNLHVDTSAIQAGATISIGWEDWNLGSSPASIGFTDHIVVRNLDSNAVLLDTGLGYDPLQNGAIQPGTARSRTLDFRLPDGLAGAGSIGITVTADQNTAGQGVLFEFNAANNGESNNAASMSIVSQAAPYADLNVAALSVPAAVSAGDAVNVAWTVVNAGSLSAAGGWTDRIVLSKDGVIGNADDVILANVARSTALAALGSYSQSATVRIPTRIEGSYRIAVVADASATVLEPDTRSNNTRWSDTITITPTIADLVPELTLVPAEATASRSARVEWQVANRGTIATDVNLWVDQVYLSASNTLDTSAFLLGTVTHVGTLEVNGSYSAGLDVLLPVTTSGPMFFLVKTDVYGSAYEPGTAANNNVAAAGQATSILPQPKANLQVANLQAPALWNAGDALDLAYTVQNTGNEIASTLLAEKIRLVDSTNAANVLELRTVSQGRSVNPGAAYIQTLRVAVPVVGAGNWRLEVIADATGLVNEQNETDNTASQIVTIVHPDVMVSGVSVQGARRGGETIDIAWTTSNIGSADAANVREAVYLSRNGVLDGSDIKLGEFTHALIAAGGSDAGNLSAVLPVDAQGAYQLLMVTDANAALTETSAGEANT
ncbi:MAG: hypothetical protein JHC40_12750, partial [Burkholderiales bacterium]|nr:hypothetical protein [Burkholderiales bacterium]